MLKRQIAVTLVLSLLITLGSVAFAANGYSSGSTILETDGTYFIPVTSNQGFEFTIDEIPDVISQCQTRVDDVIRGIKAEQDLLVNNFEWVVSGYGEEQTKYKKWCRDTYYPWAISFLEGHKSSGLDPSNGADENVIQSFYDMKYDGSIIYSGHESGILEGFYYIQAIGQLRNFQASVEGSDIGGGSGIIIGGVVVLLGLGLIGKFKKGKAPKNPKAKKAKPVKQKKNKKLKKVNNKKQNPNPDSDQTLGDMDQNSNEDDSDDAGKLTLSKKSLPLVSGSGQTIELIANVVATSEDAQWQITYQADQVFTVLKTDGHNKAKFLISEKSSALDENEYIKEYTMKIVATKGSNTLERTFVIVVGKEGLFLTSEEPIKVIADMESSTALRVSAIKIIENQFQTDYGLLDAINFSFKAQNEVAHKFFDAAKVDFGVESEYFRENLGEKSEIYSVLYSLKTKHALPSYKEGAEKGAYLGDLTIQSQGSNNASNLVVKVELIPPEEPSRSHKIEEEYKNCIYIIDKYVDSPRHRQIFKKELNDWKELWGPAEIYKFRKEVWNTAKNLILAEGAQGYEKMADYYDNIAFAKKWTMWAGDIAFEVVLNAYTGLGPQATVIQAASGVFKDTVISAIEYTRDCWVDEETFSAEAWFDMEMKKLIQGTPGHLITAGSLKGTISGGAAVAYMIVYTALNAFVNSINWSKWGADWENDEIDVLDIAIDLKQAFGVAVEEVGKSLLKMGLTMMFSAAVLKSTMRSGGYVHPDHVKAGQSSIDPDVVVDGCKGIMKENDLEISVGKNYSEAELPDVITRMQKNTENGVARAEDVLAVLSDTEHNASRTMKRAPKELQESYDRGRRKIYKEHDQHLVDEISKIKNDGWCDKAPDGRLLPPEFRIKETTGSSLSQDRDFVIEFRKNGEWFEVSDRYWKETSNKWWIKRTGKSAEQHNQMAMTRHGEEASLDYSGQKIVNGRMIKTKANITNVYGGNGILIDSISLSAMWVNKIKNANCKAECIAQIKKLVYSRDKIVKSYKKQGVPVPKVSQKMEMLMGFMKLASDDMKATGDYINKFEAMMSQYTGHASIEDAGRSLALLMGEFQCQNRM